MAGLGTSLRRFTVFAVLGVSAASAAAAPVAIPPDTQTPNLAVSASAPASVALGDAVPVHVLVTNAGQVAVPAGEVAVMRSGSSTPLWHSADHVGDGDDMLEPGEKWDYDDDHDDHSDRCGPKTEYVSVASGRSDAYGDDNSHTVTTHVKCTTSVSVSKTTAKDTYSPGETITYTITVTNTGQNALQTADISVVDGMLTDLAPAPGTPAVLAPGATMTLSGSHVATTKECGPLTNHVTVRFHSRHEQSMPPDPSVRGGMPSSEYPEDAEQEAHAKRTVKIACKEDLSLAKTADKATYAPGETIVYTLTVTNSGTLPIGVNRIHVFDPTLPGLSLVGTAPASLQPGASLVYRGTRIATATDCGPLVNVASVSLGKKKHTHEKRHKKHKKKHKKHHPKDDDDDSSYGKSMSKAKAKAKARATARIPARTRTTASRTLMSSGSDDDEPTSREIATATVTVTVLCTTNISVVKTADRAQYAPGDTINYRITITNTGTLPLDTTTIAVSDPQLPNLAWVAPVPALLAPGATVSLAGSRVTTAADCGSVLNAVTVGVPGDANPSDNTSSVTVTVAGTVCTPTPPTTPPTTPPVVPIGTAVPPPPTVLAVDKTGPALSKGRRVIPFRIVVTNTGSTAALDVQIRDLIPAGMALVRVPRGAKVVKGSVTWSIGTLQPGASASRGLWLRPVSKAAARRCNTATAQAGNAPITQDVACTRILKVAGVQRLPVAG